MWAYTIFPIHIYKKKNDFFLYTGLHHPTTKMTFAVGEFILFLSSIATEFDKYVWEMGHIVDKMGSKILIRNIGWCEPLAKGSSPRGWKGARVRVSPYAAWRFRCKACRASDTMDPSEEWHPSEEDYYHECYNEWICTTTEATRLRKLSDVNSVPREHTSSMPHGGLSEKQCFDMLESVWSGCRLR